MRSILLIIAFPLAAVLPGLAAADDGWQARLAELSHPQAWVARTQYPPLTAEALDEAIEAARVYYQNHQLPEGNFRYGLDLTDDIELDDDNAVRQAGALWGLSVLNRERFTESTRRAVLLGLDFFIRSMRPVRDGKLMVSTYQGQRRVKTGMVALVCLAITDFLDGQDRYLTDAQRAPYANALLRNLEFLQSMEMADGSWGEVYDHDVTAQEQEAMMDSSPYYDGEALLAYVTALRYFRSHPQFSAPAGMAQRVESALPRLMKKYAVDALQPDGDRDQAKGFYQWGAMASAVFCEDYPQSPSAAIAANGALALTWWQLFENQVEFREGNTGYAVEGLIAAWLIASRTGRHDEARTIRNGIGRILAKLLTWQVGTAAGDHNPFLAYWRGKGVSPRAFGGVLAARDSGYIRIDNVQHQLHAMLLARKYLFP